MNIYEQTSLTPMRVAQMSGYVDWASQPSLFKHYPDFLFSYTYGENERLKVAELSRIITLTKEIGAKPYHQLNLPSAGNLHPVELYIQVRGVKGVLSGIYHLNPELKKIVLIREVEAEGIEPYVGLQNKFKGFIYLISSVPFRSEWKYGVRALRYIYLDIGHQIAAVHDSNKLFEQKLTILSDYDVALLNDKMGFKGEEFISCVMCSGELSEHKVKGFKQNLMHVSPTSYDELSKEIASIISKNTPFKSQLYNTTVTLNEEALLQRRSAREFKKETMPQELFAYFMGYLSKKNYPLECYNIVLKSGNVKMGVYYNNKCIKEGDFAQKMVTLLVNQNFVKNAEIITVICSQHFSANKLMLSAFFVHNLYIQSQVKGISCSGIGAFYDNKLQKFLETNASILYISAIGM